MNKKLTGQVAKANSRPRGFAFAALAASMLLCLPAQAFNLGNLNMLSDLGEPLRLEYEVLNLSPAELESLQITLAEPASYASRGLVYGSALEGMRLGLVRDANDNVVIRMEGQRPAVEPFVDLLLNITWASGATTRSVSVMLPQALTPSTSSSAATLVPAPRSAGSLKVQPGDTAGELASRQRPPSVSQGQYLLALAKANPGAFIEGNVNRLQAGATLTLPTEAQAQATAAAEARQIIAAQWEEFLVFRQQLAAAPPAAAPDRPVARAADGEIERLRSSPNVLAPSDKLTLSKPTAQGNDTTDQALLSERQAKDAEARVEELAVNMRALNQLEAKAGSSEAPSLGAPEGSATNSTDTRPAVAAALPAPPPTSTVSLVDRLADHPAVLPLAGGLLGLALAWLGLRLRRKSAAHAMAPTHETGQATESPAAGLAEAKAP